MSVVEPFDLIFEPQQAANVLHATATHFYDPANPTQGSFTLTALNKSKTWVSVVVQVVGGNTIFDTGHFDPDQKRFEESLIAPYGDQEIKIVRWAPGIAGIAGDGGGDIRFTMPSVGSLDIQLTVVSG